jgi:hypothetical protein
VIAGLLLLLTGAALFQLRRLDANPYLLPPRWDGPPPSLPDVLRDAEAAIVIDPTGIQGTSTGRFSDRDFSGAWWNWLTQEIGPGAVLTPDALTPARLESIRLLVLTRSAAHAPTVEQLAAVHGVVDRGGAVLLELPAPGWEGLSGVALSGPEVTGGRLTHAAFALTAEEQAAFALLELPARHRVASATTADTSAVLEVDGSPVAFLRRLGPGRVLTLAIDLGQLWQTLQQGRPDDDQRVRNRYPDIQSLPLETSDMVADRALLKLETPVADVLEDGLFRLLSDEIALPSWWLFPRTAPGALLITHDEEGMGSKASWMAEADHAQGCTSTNFLVPSPALRGDDLSVYRDAAAEIGLHYVLPGPDGEDYPGSGFDLEGRFETYGLWKLQPLRRLLTPAEQWRWLDARNPGLLARVSRTHFLAWTRGYTDLFAGLVAAGIRLDSSYGPDLNDRGYLFGTGRPFRPLGPTGLPMPVLELPYVSAEDLGGADGAFLKRMLEDSASRSHQAVTVLFHPNSFRWHPSVPNYLAWRGLCGQARQLELWVPTCSELEAFSRARETATLRSTASGDVVSIGYAGAAEGTTLAVPARWLGRPLRDVTGLSVSRERTVLQYGSNVRLLELPPGSGSLELHYAPTDGGATGVASGAP